MRGVPSRPTVKDVFFFGGGAKVHSWLNAPAVEPSDSVIRTKNIYG